MSELTERIEALERENQELKARLNRPRQVSDPRVLILREVIGVLREEFSELKEHQIAQLLPRVVRVEF